MRRTATLAAIAGLTSFLVAPTPTAAAKSPRPGGAARNQLVLTLADSQRLVRWATRYRACLAGRGVKLGRLAVRHTEIDLPLRRGPERRALMRLAFACGDGLGGPPSDASLQIRPRGFVLYLPRQCLIDERVTTRSG